MYETVKKYISVIKRTKAFVMSKYSSFAITFRPRDGVTDAHITKFMKYVRRTCQYYYVVTEKVEDARHIHAGIFLSSPKTKNNICIDLKRIDPTLDDDEKRNINRGVRIQYNFDFIQNYLDKDDDTVLVSKNLPEVQRLDAYWPPDEEQRLAQSKKAIDKYYANLEALWHIHAPVATDTSRDAVADFLFDMMYNRRLIRVLKDDRTVKNTVFNLKRYLSKATRHDLEWEPWLNDK